MQQITAPEEFGPAGHPTLPDHEQTQPVVERLVRFRPCDTELECQALHHVPLHRLEVNRSEPHARTFPHAIREEGARVAEPLSTKDCRGEKDGYAYDPYAVDLLGRAFWRP